MADTEKRELKGSEISLLKEINYIVDKAVARASRVVIWGPLIFFSTQSGDAWALDPEDQLAVCLARNGAARPVKFAETESKFATKWETSFQIDGEIFTVIDKSGRITSILGYPTKQILRHIDEMNDETMPF